MTYLPRQRAFVLAGTLATLLVAAGPAAAQQQTPLPPGSPLIGRPDTEAAKKLAPVAPPPLPAAADKLPLDKLKAPKGFTIDLYASGVDNARTLRLGDKGTVFVSSRIKDKIHAIVDKDGKREVKVIASGLHRPNGIVLHKGTLYIAELSQISKIENVEDKLDNPPKPTVIFSDLPKDEAHGWKYLTIGPDEKLYFQVGAPCNICMPPERHAKIYRLNLDGSGLEVVASGIRQIVGMDWHPVLKQLYFTENQRDWLSEDIPEDKLKSSNPARQGQLRIPLLPPGQYSGPGIWMGPFLRGVHQAHRAAGAARGGFRNALLHWEYVPGRLPQPNYHRAAWLVEPQHQDRG